MLHEISPNKSYEIKKNVEHSHKSKRVKQKYKKASLYCNNKPAHG